MAAEIISTVERRRHWPDEEKLRILSEALAPGATVAAVADGNGVSRSLVYLWLRLARAGRLPGISLADPPRLSTRGPSFVPVRIEPPLKPARDECPSSTPSPLVAAPPRRRPSVVEIVLGNGRSLKVDDNIDPAALARLVCALEDGARLRQDGGAP